MIPRKLHKKSKRFFRGIRRYVASRSPEWMHKRFGPTFDYFDMYILDHGILRVIYSNLHQVAEGVWRASQPAPYQIKGYSKRGIKTIINLRGERECGGYRLEEKNCKKYGIDLVNLTLSSRYPPSRETIYEAKKVFESVEYPFLMHCKSGADRAGLASALFLLMTENRPVEVAKKQLSLKYGHIKQAETGVLDHIFECYMETRQDKDNDLSFLDWVDEYYDPQNVRQTFHSNAWANRFVSTVLQRE